jgi:ATP-binding cassette, subfamily C, bacterial
MTTTAVAPAERLASTSATDAAQLVEFVGYMGRRGGRRAALALLFLILGSLTEGISILLLVPILHLAGNAGQGFALPVPDWEPLRLLFPSGTVGFASVLAALVLLVVAQAFFLRFKSVYMARLLDDFVNRLRMELFESIGLAKWGLFTRIRTSDLELTVNADIERVQACGYYALMLVQALVLLSVYVIVSLLISPAMTIVAMALGGLMFAALRPFRRRAAAFGQVITNSRQTQYRTVSEFLAGMKVAKSLNIERVYFDRLGATLDRMKADNARYVGASTLGSALFQIASVAGLAVFVYVAFTAYRMSLPEVVVLLLVFMRVAPRFMDIQNHVQQILVSLPAFRSMTALKARFDAEREAETGHQDGTALPLSRQIEIRGVSFAYGERRILDDVSFVIPAREVTALIGPSGSGKSTIADMLLGLLEPGEGSILVDGRPIDASARRNWRRQVAYVPQDVFLLHDTIAANLRLSRPEASDEELWAALRAAKAEGFVREKDDGLDAVVGDRGVRLSGGERQRIALARALLRRPSLLILDEATSALDWENQAAIADSIRALRGSITVLTIAHRPSMISFADRVVALEAGCVVETGTYAALSLEAGSRLARLLAGEGRAAEAGEEGARRSTDIAAGPAADGLVVEAAFGGGDRLLGRLR